MVEGHKVVQEEYRRNTVLAGGRTRPHVAVLMGGRSAEREISLVTGSQVAAALEESEYPVSRIDASMPLWREIERVGPDVVFVALHGKYGEDGTVQALLELMEIPYTGSGVLSSALAMDKAMSKSVFRDRGLPVAESTDVTLYAWQKDPEEVIDRIAGKVGLPCVVKPSRQGSAMGVHLAKKAEDLRGSLVAAFEYDDVVLVEEFLPGIELTVGVLGHRELRALPSVEITPEADFYDFESKYVPGRSRHVIPARLEEGVEEVVASYAIAAHRALDCRDMSRVDFKLDSEGSPRLLEVNTIPGMTPTSLFPEAAKAAGIVFTELVETLIGYAMERA